MQRIVSYTKKTQFGVVHLFEEITFEQLYKFASVWRIILCHPCFINSAMQSLLLFGKVSVLSHVQLSMGRMQLEIDRLPVDHLA